MLCSVDGYDEVGTPVLGVEVADGDARGVQQPNEIGVSSRFRVDSDCEGAVVGVYEFEPR